jgi:phage shock protein C
MSYADELSRLADLHQRGALSDDEFARAKARVLNGATSSCSTPMVTVNGLQRSATDRWIGGICGGVAEFTGIAAWIWRLSFVLLTLCGGGGLLMYLLLWFFVPTARQVHLVRA